MTDEEWRKAKETFPWTHEIEVSGLGGIIRLKDKSGKEVPLQTMVMVMERLTLHISKK